MQTFRMMAVLAAGLAIAPLAIGQAYPNKPIRIIVAYQAGQGTDVAARYIGDRLSSAVGQPVVIDNKPGAGGNIGTEATARAAPDGYTLTMGTNATHGTNQFLYETLPFDAEKDFEPVILIGSFPMAIAANPAFPGNGIAEVIAYAKSTPKGADVAMPSTTARIVYELFKKETQAPVVGIPYKGSATAIAETMGGQVPLVIDTVTAHAPNFRASILGRQVLSPLDLERRFGLIDGDIFHGRLSLEQLFFSRPLLGHADYRTPIRGLYLCGSGTHPGGGVTGAPGHNAAREIIRDWKRRAV